MMPEKIKELVDKVNDLKVELSDLGETDALDELLLLIHKPGFTTPAESMLMIGVVDAIMAQAQSANALRAALLAAASRVELNPQPLPP